MRRQHFLALATISVAFLTVCATASASDNAEARASLAGVRSVCVVVEDLRRLEESALRLATVQTDVERRLRSRGIDVVQETDPARHSDGYSYLYVNVNGFRSKNARGEYRDFVTNVDVSFQQSVRLDRDSSLYVFAPTWSTSVVAITPSIENVRESVRGLVDNFAKAYRSVNPPAVGQRTDASE